MAEPEGSRRPKKSTGNLGDPVIPDKLYFRIGEVAAILGIATYVLRFWEGEFPQLHPNKGNTGQRLYRRRDVEMAVRIRRLLYDEGYTIPGARQLLKAEVRARQPELPMAPPPGFLPNPYKLHKFHSDLKEIAGILARPLPSKNRLPGTPGKQTDRGGLHLTARKSAATDVSTPTDISTPKQQHLHLPIDVDE